MNNGLWSSAEVTVSVRYLVHSSVSLHLGKMFIYWNTLSWTCVIRSCKFACIFISIIPMCIHLYLYMYIFIQGGVCPQEPDGRLCPEVLSEFGFFVCVFWGFWKLELSLWSCGVRIYVGHHVDKPLVGVCLGISTSEQKIKQPLVAALCCTDRSYCSDGCWLWLFML